LHEPLKIAGETIAPGERRTVRVLLPRRHTREALSLNAHVVHGREPGPRLFVCAAIHGDEVNGVEVIRRLLRRRALHRLRGALIAVPVVTVYGFASHSRRLPDGRDLNRSFPGSATGSLAARLAHLFMTEIVASATHGIDLHTGALHRSNLPQIRARLDEPENLRLARAFGTPVIVNATTRDGSLRRAANERGIPMLLFEGGEALRFDESSIRAGLRGVLAAMRELGMLHERRPARRLAEPFVARASTWVRAPESGMLQTRARLGERVFEGQPLGVIAGPQEPEEVAVLASAAGIVIGRTLLPLVNEGDALFHIAVGRSGRRRS